MTSPRGMPDDGTRSVWTSVPCRLYLDTSTLQTIHDFGPTVFERAPFEPDERHSRVTGLAEEVDALQAIIETNVRGGFEIVVTAPALGEALSRGSFDYSQWVSDVMYVGEEISSAERLAVPGDEFQSSCYGMISAKDRLLLQDALDRRCDAFLTVERRLATASRFVEKQTGLRILRPSGFREVLRPWAALYR